MTCFVCVLQAVSVYQDYEHLYMQNREEVIKQFLSESPHFSDFEGEMERYEKVEGEVLDLPNSQYLNAAIQLSTEPLKLALAVEAKAWKTAYGHSLNARYRDSMAKIVQFVTDYSKRLARPIKVRTVQSTSYYI